MLRSLYPKIGGFFHLQKSSQYCGSCDGKVFKMVRNLQQKLPKNILSDVGSSPDKGPLLAERC